MDPGQIAEFEQDGYLFVPAAFDAAELAAATEALSEEFPTPDEFFADPERGSELGGRFGGVRPFPWSHLDLNLLTVLPELTTMAEQLLGSSDIGIYKAELWAKYAGAGDYDQRLHRDFGNHTLVVPRADGRWRQLTTLIYISDVDEGCGPTAIVPKPRTADVPLGIRLMEHGERADQEVTVPGPAGSLLIWSTDVFHRGTDLTGDRSHRFAMLCDFKHNDMTWGGKHAWPHHGNVPAMHEFLCALETRQRSLFGFPPPGHEYWNAQTLDDTQLRYPTMDLAPYRSAHQAAQ